MTRIHNPSKSSNFMISNRDLQGESGKVSSVKMEDSNMSVYTIKDDENDPNIIVKVSDYGCAIISCLLKPTKTEKLHGKSDLVDVVLGYDELSAYKTNPPYFGVVVGRVCGRIKKSKFTLNNETHSLNAGTPDGHCLHGGKRNFSHVKWDVKESSLDSITFTYTSVDGEEGFPGTVAVEVTYSVERSTAENEPQLIICYLAKSLDKPSPINLTNHSYWNLNGHESGLVGVSYHSVYINASRTPELDSELLPTGKIVDLKTLGEDMTLKNDVLIKNGIDNRNGYDSYYILDTKIPDWNDVINKDDNISFKCIDNVSKRCMIGWTDQEGVQFYTADCLKPNMPKGKHHKPYEKFGGFCFETQGYPDAVNNEAFPSTICNPDDEHPYRHCTRFKFIDAS